MSFSLFRITTALVGASVVLAGPVSLLPRQGLSALTASQISAFRPFTFFASTAYCPSSQTQNWTCGANCDANPKFQPIAAGGDGNDVQYWYVGFDPDLSAVIVGHQGTDPHKIMSVLTDLTVLRTELDPKLFPGLSSDIKVHSGFAKAQADTAAPVLSAVKQAMQEHQTQKVTVVGHSLGAAISLLDAVYLSLQLQNIDLNIIGYGMPRVGNQEFADYIDAHINVTRITNKKDPVPIIPGKALGFSHPSHEIHIQPDNSFVSCPGQDNEDKRCSVGDAKNVIVSKVSDHDGPYADVLIGCH